jgi:hypothetical protein
MQPRFFIYRKINGFKVYGTGDKIYADVKNIHYEDNTSYGVSFYCIHWRNITYAGEIEIISPSKAYEKLCNKDVIGDVSMQFTTFPIRDIFLSYYSERDYQKYYKPVWIFQGSEKQYYIVEATE